MYYPKTVPFSAAWLQKGDERHQNVEQNDDTDALKSHKQEEGNANEDEGVAKFVAFPSKALEFESKHG